MNFNYILGLICCYFNTLYYLLYNAILDKYTVYTIKVKEEIVKKSELLLYGRKAVNE